VACIATGGGAQGNSDLTEYLLLQLQVKRFGRSSLTVDIEGLCNREVRMRCRKVMAHVSLHTGKSIDTPADVREAVPKYLASTHDVR
jgi:4-hydroxybenzoyl-CoA thioesterase